MTAEKYYDKAYIIHSDGYMIGEIEAFCFDDRWRIRELIPYLSDGDLLRCFSKAGIVDTYILRIVESADWPPLLRITTRLNNQ